LAGAILCVCAGGCTDGARTTEAKTIPEPVRGGEFHLMLESPGTLDPARADDVYETCITNQIFDGLLEFDADLHPVPCIAKEWTVSRDGKSYEFVLREDVRFHNGRRVVAEDFLYSFLRILDPAFPEIGIAEEFLRKIVGVDEYMRGEADFIAGITALDDSRLEITLESPYASFLSILAMDQTKVVPREEVERWGDAFGAHPVGTGPFRFAGELRPRADTVVVLTANDDHFRGRAHLDRVVFHTPDDYNVDRAAEALLAGTLSFSDVPSALSPQITSDPRFHMLRRTELSFSFMGLNLEKKPFDDARVRQALAHAIDCTRVASVDPSVRIEPTGILPPGIFAYSPERKGIAHDPDAARRLLGEAGYPGGRGLPRIVYWQANRGEVGKKADALIREDLQAVGFPVEFRYLTWNEFDKKMMAHEMQAFGLSWVADLPDPDSFLSSLFSSQGSYNLFDYSNATVDSLLTVGADLRASNNRAQVYRRAERIILQDAAVIPLFHIANNYAVLREVEGLVVTPLGVANFQLEKVWLSSGRERLPL
jgi:ABC-type transport system substrate-binding protein